jgi:hypothetical protein
MNFIQNWEVQDLSWIQIKSRNKKRKVTVLFGPNPAGPKPAGLATRFGNRGGALPHGMVVAVPSTLRRADD